MLKIKKLSARNAAILVAVTITATLYIVFYNKRNIAPRPDKTQVAPNSASLPEQSTPKPTVAAQNKDKQTEIPNDRWHIVRNGDSLWSISQKYYTNPLRWTGIQNKNAEKIQQLPTGSQALILPEQTLIVPEATGGLFDGRSSYIDAGTFNMIGALTLEAWVNASRVDSNAHTIVAQAETSPATHGYGLRIAPNNKFAFLIDTLYGGTGSAAWLYSNNKVQEGKWYHLAGVWDGSTMEFYVNGALQSTTEKNAFDNAGNLLIGADYEESTSSYESFFDGKIDEVRIWNKARTATEIKDNMFKRVNSTSANLAGYWRSNENSRLITYEETNDR